MNILQEGETSKGFLFVDLIPIMKTNLAGIDILGKMEIFLQFLIL